MILLEKKLILSFNIISVFYVRLLFHEQSARFHYINPIHTFYSHTHIHLILTINAYAFLSRQDMLYKYFYFFLILLGFPPGAWLHGSQGGNPPSPGGSGSHIVPDIPALPNTQSALQKPCNGSTLWSFFRTGRIRDQILRAHQYPPQHPTPPPPNDDQYYLIPLCHRG